MNPDSGIHRSLPELISEDYTYLEGLYRYFHSHPELSGQEKTTSERLATELESAGFSVCRGIGGYGIIGILKNGDGPVVMARADMDALPLREETGLSYASTARMRDPSGKEVDVMHACGHDIHMTVLAGTARILTRMKKEWSGTLMFIGQPSEETVSGAEKMMHEGIYTRFGRPDFGLSLHVGPEQPAGSIGYREGIFSAGSESLDIMVHGIGGHAAHPDQTKDPVVIAAQIILALQTIVSREVPPAEFAVITVGSVHGGIKHNAIPDSVDLQVNIRYFKPEIRDLLLASVGRVCTGIAMASGLPESLMPSVTVLNESVMPMWNDPGFTKRVAGALEEGLGKENVLRIGKLTGSEDFGVFGMADPPVPLCYFRIGTEIPGKNDTAEKKTYLHSSRFAPSPKGALPLGVRAMTIAILESLKN
jgi:amidohydrolase